MMDKPCIITPHLSYWLLPSTADCAFFQDIINTLAKTYEAPSFEPHVTIYSGPYTPQDNPEAILQQATNSIQRVCLRLDNLLYTDVFTKTLFVQFHPSPILTAISETLRHAASGPSDYSLNPHLSLIYKQLSEEAKQHLVSSLHIPQSEVIFDEVSVMLSSGRTQTPEDVENWNIIYRKKL
ncbi:MAG: cyclic phosphodiesterase-like protein [bacterium]|nr:cyclic phosphodiesterase-like protein [bacterium]